MTTCNFCGKKLTEEEETNFVHYPHEKICDSCMREIGLVTEEAH